MKFVGTPGYYSDPAAIIFTDASNGTLGALEIFGIRKTFRSPCLVPIFSNLTIWSHFSFPGSYPSLLTALVFFWVIVYGCFSKWCVVWEFIFWNANNVSCSFQQIAQHFFWTRCRCAHNNIRVLFFLMNAFWRFFPAFLIFVVFLSALYLDCVLVRFWLACKHHNAQSWYTRNVSGCSLVTNQLHLIRNLNVKIFMHKCSRLIYWTMRKPEMPALSQEFYVNLSRHTRCWTSSDWWPK